MPLDAQTPPVWNTLILECMKAGRYKLAYKLHTDMKRRGLKPTVRTYDTMLYGLSRIQDWEYHTKLLEHAHSLYENLMKHYNLVKKLDPQSSELNVDPLASYIKILADTNQHQKIFDVYYALDQDGPLAPNNFLYGAIFRALATRRAASGEDRRSVAAQNASDARMLWKQMLKRPGASSTFPADSHTVAAALRCLAYGRSIDHQLGLDIARDVLGLAKPGETAPPAKVPLSPQSLEAVLILCNNMGAPRICIHFARQAMERPRKFHERPIVDSGHINQLLKAHVALAETGSTTESKAALEVLEWMLEQDIPTANEKISKIRPKRLTYNLVLSACQHCKDWSSATRVFEVMTGYHAEDFLSKSKKPRKDKRSPGHSVFPDATTMACMARTALATGDGSNIRQCLRIIDHVQLDHILNTGMPADPEADSPALRRARSSQVTELATAILEMVGTIEGPDGTGNKRDPEAPRWNSLRTHATELIQGQVATPMRPLV